MEIMKTWITRKNGIEIFRLLGIRCNCYLVRKDGISVIIDTSVRREYATLLRRLKELQVDKLACILLTHVHFDHVANLTRLQGRFDCPVYAHSLEEGFLREGHTRLPKGTKPFTKLAIGFVGNNVWRMHRFAVFCGRVFTELSDDLMVVLGPVFEQLNLQVLHTPGHTTGSVSYLIDNEVALVGDAMVSQFQTDVFPPFANAPEQLPTTWRTLLDTGCRCFLPAHGSEISRDQVARSIEKYC
jgi:glyoxylase-like metal-dependent hydrolase (beta-lactamase superfamily II)